MDRPSNLRFQRPRPASLSSPLSRKPLGDRRARRAGTSSRVGAVLCGILIAASSVKAESPNGQPKLDRLLIYGEGFLFGVKEPSGWQGDTEHADAYQANVVLYRSSETLPGVSALILVRVEDKAGKNATAALDTVMKQYKGKHPEVEFRDLTIDHPKYEASAKLLSIRGKFYEYAIYLDPGNKSSLLFLVSMEKPRVEASPEELSTLKEVVSSLVLLSSPSFHVIER